MNISKNFTAALSLGLIATLGRVSLAEGSDDPRVRVVELPANSFDLGSMVFSGDGSTIAFVSDPFVSPEIFINTTDGWRLIYRYAGVGFDYPYVTGLSEDGSVLAFSDGNISLVYQDGLFVQLPQVWPDGPGIPVLSGRTFAAGVSGDGRVVGVNGRAGGNYNRHAVLIWDGDQQLINLRDEEDDFTQNWESGLSNDGGVVFGSYERYESLNDIEQTNVSHAWVHEDGVMMDIPNLDLGFDLTSFVAAGSGNGEAIVGWSYGRWAFDPDDGDYTLNEGPNHAWIWTRATGTVEIADPSRFADVRTRDITDDAELVLGSAIGLDEEYHQFLWYRQDNQFVMIDELLYRLGITIDADWYSFDQISSDGSKLMGLSQRDGKYSALIVTIPVRGRAISAE
jgi:WD40-like Beta Propeller Repeat